ncbi:MerR family transcriptional regulator [Ramlibacter albus]|uniref:Cobalamin B12-binding domain-containing protein n=1 Tax=Ramlibacter albus TaxID=2079448 RepID=A0A923S294_9BURK|nr:cobalamin-dependent protein [Ramlibacter albus]MBC5765244.1 cobalamin B12-binding domain-containing protein [Ramlibacter albus]
MDPYAGKPISDVERDTGLPRATLRIWERRYGFPAPLRDGRGERMYPPEQVEQLRLMARLIEQGHRPARLLEGGPEEIRRLHGEAGAPPAPRSKGVSHLLRVLKKHDVGAVRQELAAMLAREGLAKFASRDLPALCQAVGEAWGAGELDVHEEHMFTECVQDLVRAPVAKLDAATRPEAPAVLLTTFEGESHALGLLMAQAMFALQGCRTVNLGVRLPVEQVVAACKAHGADLVGLSFTATINAAQVVRGLQELRGALPAPVRIWAGGPAPVLARRSVPGVRVVQDVGDVPALLAEDFALPLRRQ